MKRERCPSCGSRGASAFGALFWVLVVLLAAWVLLHSLDYGTVRVAVYAAVARGAEAFLHPVWGAALLVLALLCFAASRRGGAPGSRVVSIAPGVRLRAEGSDSISVAVDGSRHAVAGERTVERNLEAEKRVVESFHALTRRTSAFAGDGERMAWSRAQIEDARRELYALGLAIGSELLGGSTAVADQLVDLPGDHLQLGVSRDLSGIPWELMVARRGGEHLWQLFSVTRQLRDAGEPGPVASAPVCPFRLLLIANPEAGIPGRELVDAEREAAEILELGATRPDLVRVIRKSPRSEGEMRGLLEEGFDVVHFAGHTGSAEGVRRGWVLGDGVPVNPGALFVGGRAPTLVFANACRSNTEHVNDNFADTARALMMAGVPAYLCTLAELHDSGSAAFSSAFYRAVLGGATLGMAVTAARTALLGMHPVTWANYVLYGDPALCLCGTGESEISPKNSRRASD
ncbi:MAG TPA: CHAT domain-containing protein [bacterium]|nr:CHAT domain-containing protein [bacterium]